MMHSLLFTFIFQYGNKSISVIPNSEEKFIFFSKYVTNNFTIRFLETCRYMASSFSILGSNLFTTGFEKFREMMKMLDLVTRKGVYLYEYTDNWEKLNETTLPD